MPTSWRIVKSERAATAFDGEGSRINSGRWNSIGTGLIYTSQGESLAALEILVHLQASHLLMSYSSIPVAFDNSLVEVIDPATLPANWRRSPAPAALQEIGDQWATEQRSVVLQVPSTIVPNESNFLLNPAHPDFAQVDIGPPSPFPFDQRLE
jgi:RES domain-containing protein